MSEHDQSAGLGWWRSRPGSLGRKHFKMSNAAIIPEPRDGRGAAAGGAYISLDAANRAWDARRDLSGGRSRPTRLMAGGRHRRKWCRRKAPGLAPGRYRVRRHRLAGLRGGARKAPDQDAEGRGR